MISLSWKLLSIKGVVMLIKEVKVVNESNKVLILIASGGEQRHFEILLFISYPSYF
jgi:hypothetical protein